MKFRILIFILFCGFFKANSQTLAANDLKKFNIERSPLLNFSSHPRSDVNPIIIQGFIYDLVTKEPLPYAYVIIKGTQIGVQTNKDGQYYLDISRAQDLNGKISLQSGYINYKIREVQVDKKENSFLDIGLENSPGIEHNEIPYVAKPR